MILKIRLLGVAIWLFTLSAFAQQPGLGRRLVLSPLVGETIDPGEKAAYGLFPYYSADNFQEAYFEQALTPDSLITLRTQLRDGRTVLRPFSSAELARLRTDVAARARELAAQTGPGTADSVGRRFRVTLRAGAAFDGEMTNHTPTQLEFRTTDLGIVQVERYNVVRIEELTSTLARRPANWFAIGNGNRLFFAPTARNLRRGEGALQCLSLYVLGANYGITDNFSMGLLFSAVPGLPLRYQFLALTPKVATRIAEKWHAGVGLLYLRIPDFGQDGGAFGVGLGYGVLTYGSADNNLTVGLGYGFAGSNVGSTPVLQIGGQKRVSRRVSLVSENYLIANSDAGMGGLYGIKINWRRTSLGLGALYVLPYTAGEKGLTSYVIPLYYDFTFRFGKPSR